MSTYLTRLVDRGIRAPDGAVGTRLGPVFPLGRAAGRPEEEADPGLLPETFVPGLPPLRAPVPHPSDVPTAAATAATVRANLARTGTERGGGASRREPAVQRVREPTPPRLPATDEVAAEQPSPTVVNAAPGVRMPAPDATVAAPSRVDAAGVAPPRRRTSIEGSAATPERGPAQAVPRPNAAHDPLRAQIGSRAAAPEPAPQIEVRIGSVEIRRPPEPEPVSWPTVAPRPAPAPGFDRFAAARRYVDRRWS